MADKKQQTPVAVPPIGEVAKSAEKFNKAVFDLGLLLIDEYKTGRCRDANKNLEAIIEIFKAQMKVSD